MKRQLVQIPSEQVKKLKEIDRIRNDLVGYPISKKVHILLQEKLADIFGSRVFSPDNEVLKGNWFEYIRELLPTHVIAPIGIGVTKYSKEMIGCAFTKILVASDSGKTWWCNYKEDIYNVGKFLIENLKDKKFSRDYYKKWNQFYNKTNKIFENVRKEDLSKLPNQELIAKYNLIYEILMHFHALSFDIDAIDIVLEERMKDKFEKLMKSKYKNYKQADFNSKYSTLTTPLELSYVNKEQLLLYEVSKRIKDNKNLSKLFKYDPDIINDKIEISYPSINKYLSSLVKKYWWTSLGWTVRKEKNLKSFIKDIKNIIKENPDIEKEIDRLKAFTGDIFKEKNELSSELNFDNEILSYLGIFEQYALLHDYRKEIQMKGTFVFNKFLFEVSSRFGGNYEDLIWCWPSEIIGFIKTGKIDFMLARKRKEASFFLFSKDNIDEYVGDVAIKKREEELAPDVNDIRDFKGIIASFGKVTGKAKICFSASEAVNKVGKGDILISSMTLPDYLPAMKKASAIVTDEGGITSHAAIVSRELGVPCIVGTRIATRVLNDNDQIEVNANHGVVKILDRK